MDILRETIQKVLEIGLALITRVTLVSFIWTTFALLGGALGYFYAPYWGVRKVPGPPTVPFIGHLHLLTKYGPDLFPVLAKRYGPIFRFHMGRQPIVMVASPELIYEVGVKKFKDMPDRSFISAVASSPLLSKGLGFSRGLRWSSMRNAVVPLFQSSHVAKSLPVMQEYVEVAAETIETYNGSDFNFFDLSHITTTDVIGKSSFGVDFGLSKRNSSNNHVTKDDEVQKFIEHHMYSVTNLKLDLTGSVSMIVGIVAPIFQEPVRQILKRIPWTMDWKLEKSARNLCSQLDAIVTRRMTEMKTDAVDFLSIVLKSRDSEAATRNLFTPDYISALTFEQLLVGSISTSFAISAAVYLISTHPEVEKKLLEEIDQFRPRDQSPTSEDLQSKFPYLDQVVHETQRYYLASPLNARTTIKDVEIGGYHLPKGTWVWIAAGVLSKDPQHFPDPELFRPERFDPNGDEVKQRHPYAHIPFGIGPRACMGQKFAMQQIKLTLVNLYRKYVFRPSPDMKLPVEIDYGITLNFKNGVKVRAIPRE